MLSLAHDALPTMGSGYHILVIGMKGKDEATVVSHFEVSGHNVATAPTMAEASALLSDSEYDMVYLQPPSHSCGVEEIQQILKQRSNLPVVLICVQSKLSNVNRKLVKRGVGNRFVTLFFGVLDSDGNCIYTNAGHNPPIHLGHGGRICELTEGGMVLGLFASAEYESGTIKLEPGDHLILFTDGVL